MSTRLVSLWLIFAACIFFHAPAEAQRRVALVVANGDYLHAPRLPNPTNDAALVRQSLERAGFAVDVRNDLGANAFRQVLQEFGERAQGTEVALIYYAGHGVQDSSQRNWLLPIDARLESASALRFEAINLDDAFAVLEGARLRVAVFDACRNNPLGRSWRSTGRSVLNGLAGLEVDDVLVFFSAAPGQVASDGTDVSPFARAFATRILEPGLAIQLLGGMIRDDVLRDTAGEQRPFVSASITGQPFYLIASPTLGTQPRPSVVPTRFAGTHSVFTRDASGSWTEVGGAGEFTAYFRELRVDENFVYLYDPNREGGGIIVRLPLRGGEAAWSRQNPISWQALAIVNPE